jgi:hypothetical protein
MAVKDYKVKGGGRVGGEGEERRIMQILKDTQWENLVSVARSVSMECSESIERA